MNVYGNRGPLIRLLYLAIAIVWCLITCLGRLNKRRTVVLCYHGVPQEHRRRFERQMTLIASRATGVRSIHGEYHRRGSMPRVCVTFDDAFANILDNALPITSRLGITPVVFAVADNHGSEPRWQIPVDHPDASEVTMTKEQVRGTAAAGLCRFGSHGATHRRLTALSSSDAMDEMVGSKIALESILGRYVEDFAFPYGASTPELIEAAFTAGYRCVHTMGASAPLDDRQRDVIDRMRMSPDVWSIEFALTTIGAYNWLQPLRRIVRRNFPFLYPTTSEINDAAIGARESTRKAASEPDELRTAA